MPRLLLPFLFLLWSACSRVPESYPPPAQRHPAEIADPGRARIVVEMGDPDAPRSFVQDIGSTLESASWRWTGKRPTVKILLARTDGIKLVADFTLWKGNMAQTGPVEMSFFVDNRLLDRVRYDTPGIEHFEKPVPADWLQAANPTLVAIEIDKLYTDPQDGVKLGFILTKLGFERP